MKSDPCLAKMEDYIHRDQQSVCECGSPYILLEGVAGSRKTDTLIRLGLRRHWRENKNILFLTQVGSVTDEICARVHQYLQVPLYRQSNSNHHLAMSRGKTIEVANFDAWVHRQLQDQEWKHLKTMGSYHSHKSRSLMGLDNFRGFCMKNGEYADEVLIDECQDFEPLKAHLIVSLLKKVPHVRAVFCGDYMQTIFEKSLEDNDHPISIFAGLGCKRFYMQKCFRCPAGHIDFCNKVLEKAVQKYGCRPLLPLQSDHDNKPFLFTHGSTTKKYDVHLLADQLCQMVRTLVSFDPTLTPSDFCFMMRRSNNQPVFELLRVSLEKVWNNYGYTNSVIHFMTQFDGYRNCIQWNHATGKSCLISIHGDKGKGHKVVFFLGLTHKSIPDECAMHKEQELLFHSLLNVALTRSTKYLLVGFHYAQPSVYLTQVDQLEKYCYTSWSTNPQHELWDHMISRHPPPDFLKFYRKAPLLIPTLNMLSVVDISRRFERPEDIFGFHPKVKSVRFGTRLPGHLTEDAIPILTRMCELILLKELDEPLFLRDLEWFPKDVYFTEDTRLLSWAQDFHLYKPHLYQKQVELLINTHRQVIDNDPGLKKAVEEIRSRRVYLLHSCFNTPRFRNNVASFFEKKETPSCWWDLSLLFHGLHHSQHRVMDVSIPFSRLMKNIHSFLTCLSGKMVFRPCHDILASILDPSTLEKLGFERGLDEAYFENGYYYGILGTSSLIDDRSLYNLKVSPHPFSMEWFIQTCFHANMPLRKAQKPPEKLVVVNFWTGKMYVWGNTFQQHPRKLLKRLLTLYSFPENLSDHLYRVNVHRFKHYAPSHDTSCIKS